MLLASRSRSLSFGELTRIPTPPSTPTFVPISHADLVSRAREALAIHHLTVEDESFAVSPSGDLFFGTITVSSRVGLFDDPLSTSRITVGLRNSHNHEFAAGICVGFRVLVCDNLSFYGDRTLSRRHTLHIRRDLPRLLEGAIGSLVLPAIDEVPVIMGTLAETLLDEGDYASLLVRMMRFGILTCAEVGAVDREYMRTDGPGGHFPAEPFTAWRLLNAITEVQKTSRAHPNTIARRSQAALRNLMPASFSPSHRETDFG